MVISFLFSAALYGLAKQEFERGFGRQGEIINRVPRSQGREPLWGELLIQSKERLTQEATEHILTQLLIANSAIFVVGGGLSYVLARKTLEPIEEAHHSLEQFTADASHELRTPIAVMKSEIEVALMQKNLTHNEIKELLGSNLEELNRLTALTEGLLAVARKSENFPVLKRQPLQPIIMSAIKKMQTLAKNKNITIQCEALEKRYVHTNAEDLQAVIVILLDNAIKYSHPNSSMEIRVNTKRDRVAIEIIDYGVGITADDLPHVFERFYRADTSRAQTVSGHGLGLAIAQQLVERLHGNIALSSSPNKSTVATISLPKTPR